MSRRKAGKSRRPQMQGPPPRAGLLIDAVMTRSAQIDLRKVYVGPTGADPEDVLSLMSATISTLLLSLFREADARKEATSKLLGMIESMISDYQSRDLPPLVRGGDLEAGLDTEADVAKEAKSE